MWIKKSIIDNWNWVKYLLLVPLVAVQIYAGIIPGWQKIQSDFPNYYTSAKLIADGKDVSRIYDDKWFNEQIKANGIDQQGKFSPFPPPTALLLLEFSSFDPLTAKRIWLVLNIFLFLFCARIIQQITEWKFSDCATLILLCGLGLANNFRLGQMYLLLLLIVLLGYHLAEKNKSFAGGLLLGAGIAVKYFPVILLPAYFRDRKILYGSIISFLLINGIAFYFFGAAVYMEFFRHVFLPHLGGHISSQSQWSPAFQSWNSFFSNLFLFDAVGNTNPFVNSLLLFFMAKYSVHLILISASVLTFLKLKNHPHIKDIALILLCTTSLALLPASATYHFLLIIFPLVLLLRMEEKITPSIFMSIILFSAVGFAPFILHFMPASVSENLFIVYHRLWLVTLFYFLVIFVLVKAKLINKN